MRCKYSFADISDYLDDIMSEEMKQKLMEHMQMCENCRSYYTSLSLTKKYVEEKIKLGKDFRGSIIQSIDKDRYQKVKISHYISKLMHKFSPVGKQGIVIVAACACLLLIFSGSISIKSILGNTDVSKIPTGGINTCLTGEESIFIQNTETQHFIVYDSSDDASFLTKASAALEKNYERVSKDLGSQFEKKTAVRIWPDIEKLHIAIGKPYALDDVTVGYLDSTLHILKPQTSGGRVPDNFAIDAIVHIMIATINHGNTIPWMHAGIEDYESGYFDAYAIRDSLSVLAKGGRMPTVTDMLQRYYSLSDYRELSFSLTEFILREYGPDKLKRLIEAPYDVEDVFGLSENELKEKWAVYILEDGK